MPVRIFLSELLVIELSRVGVRLVEILHLTLSVPYFVDHGSLCPSTNHSHHPLVLSRRVLISYRVCALL